MRLFNMIIKYYEFLLERERLISENVDGCVVTGLLIIHEDWDSSPAMYIPLSFYT